MSNLRVLGTAEDKELTKKKKFVKDTLKEWLRMDDIEELYILGRIAGDVALRERTPGYPESRLWWLGALDAAKFSMNCSLEETREDYIEPEKKEGDEEDV